MRRRARDLNDGHAVAAAGALEPMIGRGGVCAKDAVGAGAGPTAAIIGVIGTGATASRTGDLAHRSPASLMACATQGALIWVLVSGYAAFVWIAGYRLCYRKGANDAIGRLTKPDRR